MITDSRSSQLHLDELRQAFDHTFSRAPVAQPSGQVDLLCIRIAGHGYALRLAEIACILIDRSIVPQPSSVPELVGLAAARGLIIPVYDLGALLGYESARPRRFLALVSNRDPVALAFDALEEQLRLGGDRVARAERQQPTNAAASGELVHELARTPGGVRPILTMGAVVAAIELKLGLNVNSRSAER
jgi:chemotaxis signal transduction protein